MLESFSDSTPAADCQGVLLYMRRSNGSQSGTGRMFPVLPRGLDATYQCDDHADQSRARHHVWGPAGIHVPAASWWWAAVAGNVGRHGELYIKTVDKKPQGIERLTL
jgi:hypothetical protein